MPPPRKISHSCSAGTLPTFSQLLVGGDGLLLVPPPTRPPSAHHGHAHIPHGSGLLRVWVEVRTSSLHVYPHEAASLPSMVVTQLDQCTVSRSQEATNPPHRVLVSLKGREQVSLYLDTEGEADTWAGMLRVTTGPRNLQLEGLNLECGAAGQAGHEEGQEQQVEEEQGGEEGEEAEGGNTGTTKEEEEEEEEEDDADDLTRQALDNIFGLLHPYYCEDDDAGSGDSCETESQEEEEVVVVRDGGDSVASGGEAVAAGGGDSGGEGVKLRHQRRPSHGRRLQDATRHELLQQMLATKALLEKKQKNRRSGAGAWVVTAGEVVNEYDRAQHEAQQLALRRAVILRQRKNSTAIKMATLERQQSAKKKKKKKEEEPEVTEQLEVLRRRLSSLDSQLRESEQDTERTIQDLEKRRNKELHLINDLGGVDQGLEGGLGGTRSSSVEEPNRPLLKNSHGGSFMGSLSSIPSIVVSSSEKSEKKSPEKIFGFKVGGRDGRGKGRNPLHFLDLKLRVSRRHKSTESLSTSQTHIPPTPLPTSPLVLPVSYPPSVSTPHRSHSSTPANGSCSDNSSEDEIEQQLQQQQQLHEGGVGGSMVVLKGLRTEVSPEALQEIEAFKQLIERYFATHPRHDSITQHRIIL